MLVLLPWYKPISMQYCCWISSYQDALETFIYNVSHICLLYFPRNGHLSYAILLLPVWVVPYLWLVFLIPLGQWSSCTLAMHSPFQMHPAYTFSSLVVGPFPRFLSWYVIFGIQLGHHHYERLPIIQTAFYSRSFCIHMQRRSSGLS